MVLQNNITVIIPVYNAEAFVSKAVASALSFSEVAEVILIEDGSTDDSLEVCKCLALSSDKIKLFTHPGNANRGAGLSRNVGIQHAQYEYLAFLDADDVYLENRFDAEKEIFKRNEVDGVYGALGFNYYSEAGKQKYLDHGFEALTTVSKAVPPQELFRVLTSTHPDIRGYFSLVTLTLKKSVFYKNKMPLFCDLRLHQDTVFLIQLSLNCRLESGIITEPVGLRGVHDNNRIVNNTPQSKSRLLMWKTLYNWSVHTKKEKKATQLFQAFLAREILLHTGRVSAFLHLCRFSIVNRYFLKESFFFNEGAKKVFGKFIAGYVIVAKNKIYGTKY